MRSSPLIQQNENSGPHLRFATGGQQSEISHCVPIRVGDMLREDVDKFLVYIVDENPPSISCILCQVLDTIHSDPCETMLGNRWSSYVSPVVL